MDDDGANPSTSPARPAVGRLPPNAPNAAPGRRTPSGCISRPLAQSAKTALSLTSQSSSRTSPFLPPRTVPPGCSQSRRATSVASRSVSHAVPPRPPAGRFIGAVDQLPASIRQNRVVMHVAFVVMRVAVPPSRRAVRRASLQICASSLVVSPRRGPFSFPAALRRRTPGPAHLGLRRLDPSGAVVIRVATDVTRVVVRTNQKPGFYRERPADGRTRKSALRRVRVTECPACTGCARPNIPGNLSPRPRNDFRQSRAAPTPQIAPQTLL
jgi:hypothetical protein